MSGGTPTSDAARDVSDLAGKLNRLFEGVHAPSGAPLSNVAAGEAITETTGVSISSAYIWQLRTGVKTNPTLRHLRARRRAVDMLTTTLSMSERLACKAVGLTRSTYRRLPQAQTPADPDAEMRAWLRGYARKYPCHGTSTPRQLPRKTTITPQRMSRR